MVRSLVRSGSHFFMTFIIGVESYIGNYYRRFRYQISTTLLYMYITMYTYMYSICTHECNMETVWFHPTTH